MHHEEIEATPMLALDHPRVLPITVGGRILRYHFRVITEKDWLKYFSGIVSRTMQSDGQRQQVYDDSAAADELVRSTVRDVEGYSGEKKAGWPAMLPVSHVTAIALVLGAVGPIASEEEPVLSDLVEVSLHATWTQGEHGRMLQYSGLIHRFRQPTAAQLKRFRTESSRTWITGSSQSPITNYMSKQIVAAKLYDEMIDSVDGYSVHGQPLDRDVDEIVRHMDTLHKATAVLQVFAPRMEDIVLGTAADEDGK